MGHIRLDIGRSRSAFHPVRFSWLVLLPILAFPATHIAAQVGSTDASPAPNSEATRAADFYKQGKMIDALPIYDDLAKRFPEESLYAERLGACLLAESATVKDPAKRRKLLVRAHDQGLTAQRLGDHGDYLGVLLGIDPDHPSDFTSIAPGDAGTLMNDGEAAFSRGDFPAAYKAYSAAAAANPGVYEAALFAGDAAFAQHDAGTAGQWFAKAVAINPNRESAYRYWGDSLEASGHPEDARSKFIDAIVAEPYSKTAWSGLIQWAPRHQAILQAPEIQRPAITTTGGKNELADPVKPNPGDPATAAWAKYAQLRASWRQEDFPKAFPDMKEYRHTLREESECLHAVAVSVRQQNLPPEKLDAGLSSLLDLDKAGMLEPWILISGADGSIAKDYPGYRDAHRDQLRSYLEHYILREKGSASTQ